MYTSLSLIWLNMQVVINNQEGHTSTQVRSIATMPPNPNTHVFQGLMGYDRKPSLIKERHLPWKVVGGWWTLKIYMGMYVAAF